MRWIIASLASVLFIGGVESATAAQAVTTEGFLDLVTMRLWPGPAPAAKGDGPSDIPSVTVFRPENGHANGSAVIVAPGGAYVHLASNLEGRQVADWFATRGITAFVLNYRVGERYPFPVPLADAQRAIRLVRANAKLWNILPDRIGIIGFSAGGHLAAMAATSSSKPDNSAADPVERVSGKPDFLVLGYAALLFLEPDSNNRSMYCSATRIPDCDPRIYAHYTPETLVTPDSPPTFLYHTSGDGIPAEGSIRFYRALREKKVPAELHVFEKGEHGSGLGQGDPSLGLWPAVLEAWLRGHGFLNRPAT